jgi:hypothetical protein
MIYPTWIKLMGQYPYNRKVDENVPNNIVKNLREAGNCLAIGSVDAVAVMCGKILEELVRDYGIKGETYKMKLERLKDAGHIDEMAFRELTSKETLYNQIEQLKGEGKLYNLLYEAISEIRKWRNIGAHNDKTDTITQNEARKLVELTTRVIQHISETTTIKRFTEQLAEQRKATDD